MCDSTLDGHDGRMDRQILGTKKGSRDGCCKALVLWMKGSLKRQQRQGLERRKQRGSDKCPQLILHVNEGYRSPQLVEKGNVEVKNGNLNPQMVCTNKCAVPGFSPSQQPSNHQPMK